MHRRINVSSKIDCIFTHENTEREPNPMPSRYICIYLDEQLDLSLPDRNRQSFKVKLVFKSRSHKSNLSAINKFKVNKFTTFFGERLLFSL